MRQRHRAVRGQTTACPLVISPFYFPATSQVEVRVHHAFIWDLFWHRVTGSQEMPGAQTDP